MPMPHGSSPILNHARFVGRVGALAVALGIGAAIGHGAGLASADDGASGSGSGSTSGSSASSGASDSPSTKKAPEKNAEAKRDRNASDRGTDAASERSVSASTNATAATRKPAATATDGADPDADFTETAAGPGKPKKRSPRPSGSSDAASPSDERDTVSHRATMAQTADTASTSATRESTPAVTPAADPPVRPSPTQEPPDLSALGVVRRENGLAATPAVTAASVTATSPLGTQQQLAAEQTATRTAESLPVALMKLVLQFAFRATAQQQFAQVGGPDQGNVDQLTAAVDEYAMGAAFQQQILDSNAPTVVMQVAPPHKWYGQTVPGSRILYDNPDTVYRFMGVNAASSYVIHGQFTGEVPADTTFSVLTGLSGNTASVLSGRDLVVAPDGSFTVTVSRDPAAPGETNHLQLTNDSTLIATRNTLSDWGTQVPMTLSIERVGGPPDSLFSQLGGFAIPGLGPLVVGNPLLTSLVSLIPPLADPPPLLRGVVAAVIMALGIQREATYMAVATTDPQTGGQIAPNVLKNPTRNAEFLATQLQSAGYFQLTDDQALVVTVDPGNAGYFVLPITNDWTISNDYWNQQTSLNDSQAIANPDGTYTLVISKSDPGVANWVSTGGLNQGTISMRFQDLDPDSADLPTVSSQVVPLDQLGSVLPAGTVYYDAAQRSAQLAARKAGFDTRFAPYPQP